MDKSLITLRPSEHLVKTLFTNARHGDILELTVVISDSDLNVRDFSNFLGLIYRVDGLLSYGGLARYSRMPHQQIEVKHFRPGSIQLIFEKIIESTDANTLVILWLVLKYLPQVLNSMLDLPMKAYDVLLKREEYLEKSEKRKFRNVIRSLMQEEPDLVHLDKKARGKIIALLEQLYVANGKKLSATSRFSVRSVKKILLRLKNK